LGGWICEDYGLSCEKIGEGPTVFLCQEEEKDEEDERRDYRVLFYLFFPSEFPSE